MNKWKKLDRLYLCFAMVFIISLGIILFQINNNERKKVLIMQNTTTMSDNVNNNGVNNEGNNGSSSFEETSNEKPNVSQTEEVFKEISIININTATSEELQTLKGIGPSKAQAIIDYRNSKGNFNDITEIVNVSGIGDKTFERIKEYITSGKD